MGKKYLSLPWVGQFDVSPIQKIVDTRRFQASLNRAQTGFSNLIFRSANSTRGAIELTTWKITKDHATRRLVEERYISKEVAHNINLTSLLHDIGHGPFSHAIEFLTKIDHEENGARLIESDTELREAIVGCGGDPQFMIDCLRKKCPEFVIVDDKNFGTDKLVYLTMAGMDTGFGPRIEGVVLNILEYLGYRDGKMLVDIKAIHAAMLIQQVYNYFYKDFFISKSSSKVQRYMQKMIYHLLKVDHIAEDELWDMTDRELLGRFENSEDPIIQHAYRDIYSRGIDAYPRTGLSIRLKGHAYMERNGKDNLVKEANRDFFVKFYGMCGPDFLDMLEKEIAEIIKVDHFRVVVVSLSPSDLEKRFRPQDVHIMNSVDPDARSLMELRPGHFASLADDYKDSLAIRVCVEPKYRTRLCREGEDVFNLIAEKIGYLQ